MKCPHCNEEIQVKRCPNCEAENLFNSRYCSSCGELIEDQEKLLDVWSNDGDDFDVEDRVLCPDGTCTGIIIEGKCTECGKMSRE